MPETIMSKYLSKTMELDLNKNTLIGYSTIFQRLNEKSAYEGTGIGLALCKKIVENHMGYITATGEVGKGSTFYIYLPA
jgi:light-regulated signal transduction histidine kinase (bacteriophytochrome)